MQGGREAIKVLPINESFKFIAPNDISYNIGHTYAEYEGVGSRVSELSKKINKMTMEGSQSWEAVKGVAKDAVEMDKKILSNAVSTLKNTSVTYSRIDSALTYQNSERRDFTFEFTLMHNSSIQGEVFLPVRRLEELSCPEISEGVKVLPPYIFSINTIFGSGRNSKLISCNAAALYSVQPK
jgi:hypothetical protein